MVQLKKWWQAVIYGEVFPESPADLPGLCCVGPDGKRAVILKQCPQEFDWEDYHLTNHRRNKYYGHLADDPSKTPILLCLDHWPNEKEPWNGVRFYRRV